MGTIPVCVIFCVKKFFANLLTFEKIGVILKSKKVKVKF